MIKLIVIIIIALILTGCASAPPAQAAAITPRSTQPASAVPSPTLDYRATMQAGVDAAAADAAVSRRNELDAQQRAIYSQQTADAAQVQALTAKMTLGAQELDRINANATQSSIAATRSANEYSYWAARQTATARAPALIMAVARAESDAKIAEWDSTIRAWTGLILSTAGLVMMICILIALWQRQPAIVDDEPEAVPEPDTFHAGLNLSVFDGIATPEQLYKLAVAVMAGTPLTHNNFTPSEILFSEGKFASVQFILVKYGLAVWNDPTHKGGITPTDDGRKFFASLATTPPAYEDTPGMRHLPLAT